MITIKHDGDFRNTERLLKNAIGMEFRGRLARILNRHGEIGIAALSSATPKDSGLTASSWKFLIRETARGFVIDFFNTNMIDNVIIAIILQYGHGLANGRYLQGIDYINPAIRPIFHKMAEAIWKEVTSL